jgi:hypothetical protein
MVQGAVVDVIGNAFYGQLTHKEGYRLVKHNTTYSIGLADTSQFHKYKIHSNPLKLV